MTTSIDIHVPAKTTFKQGHSVTTLRIEPSDASGNNVVLYFADAATMTRFALQVGVMADAAEAEESERKANR